MRRVFLAIFAAAIPFDALAADPKGDADGTPVFGFTSHREPGKACKVTATLNRAEFITGIPTLKTLGMLNPDYVTQTVINLEPTTLAMTFLFEQATALTQGTFQDDSTVTTCSFSYSILDTDDYGNDRKMLAFSYSFDRPTYSKVNWDKVDYLKFPKITQRFTFGQDVQKQIAAERMMAPP